MLFRVRYAETRCVLIKRFPFLIYFVVNEEKGVGEVLAVYHTSRNPKIWLSKN